MTRQTLDGGGWLDLDTAQKFAGKAMFDGRNYLSCSTGSQWEHECLYRTKRSTYVLRHWSDWQGSHDTWTRLSADEAVAWLLLNDHEPDCPAELAIVAALEV
jgi:hypothetical protein